MANIIEQQQDLEYFPDEQLISEASQPSGRFPGYLLIAEVERRQQYRDRYNASQQAQEGEQPSIMEQAVEEYSAGIPSADPNFQGQQPGPQMAGGGKVPRYQKGLFVNPMTNEPYSLEQAKQIQGLLRQQGVDPLKRGLPGMRYDHLTQTPVEQLTEDELSQLFSRFESMEGFTGKRAGLGFGEAMKRVFTPERPYADDPISRANRMKQRFADLPGLNIPDLIRYSPKAREKWYELNEDRAAWMDWAVEDPDMGPKIASALNVSTDRLAGAPAVKPTSRQELAGKEVKGADGQTTPDATGIESLTDYGDRLARSVTGDDEGLGSLLKRGQPSTELTPEEKQAYDASIKAAESAAGIAALPAGVHSKEWSDEQARLLTREAFDDTEFATYLEGVPGTIREMRDGLEVRIRSQIETRGERDEDMKKALKDALIGGDEIDRRSTSMLLGVLGRAVMKVGIDSVGASEILAQGASDIWDYKRSANIENLDIQKSLNEIARKADSDELRLHEAMVNNNTAEITSIIDANSALLTQRQADDALRNSITTGIENARVADQNAIRGRAVDMAEAEARVAEVKLAKATLTRSLIEKGQEYYAKTFAAIVNAWSAMYSSVSAQNSQEANRLQQIKLAIDILETELTNMTPAAARQEEIQAQMQSLISQLGLDLAAPSGTEQGLAGGTGLQ